MRVTNVSLYSNNKEVANLSFRDPKSLNPYIAKAIIGIDADEIIPKFYGFSTSTQTKQKTLLQTNREIVLRMALNPQFSENVSYSDLRDDLYRAIASSRSGVIQLRFNDGKDTIAAISGSVTKFEAPHFSKTPEVQITLECDSPTLKALEEVQEDPFSLEYSMTINNPLSTAPHGFKFDVTFNGVHTFVIQDTLENPEWFFEVRPEWVDGYYGFQPDDQLYFSSESDNKYVYIVRSATYGGGTYQLTDRIMPGSVWPILFPGFNEFEFRALNLSSGEYVGTESEEFTWNTFSYYPTYWGV